jgi:integral membrane sensor domain MASE1
MCIYTMIYLHCEVSMTVQLWDTIFTRLTYRKIYHFTGGALLIFGLSCLDSHWFTIGAVLYLLLFTILSKRISLAVIGVVLLLWLSGSRFTTLGATITWVIGDGVAAIIGAAYGKTAWPWHESKTLLGSGSGFIAAALATVLFLVLSTNASIQSILILTFASTLVGCLLETLPLNFIGNARKANDNPAVILGVGLVFHLLVKFYGIQPIR